MDSFVDAHALPEGEAHVWWTRTALCDTPLLREYYRSLLSPSEAARLEQFAFDYLKLEYLVTRALCRTTLSKYATIPPQGWRFRENAYGRPEIDLDDDPLKPRFNLSNTPGLVSCVVARTVDVGIDLEETQRSCNMASIADQCFSLQEQQNFDGLPAERRREQFFALWTLKESYIKARGMGLSIPLGQVSFDLSGESIRVAFDPALSDVSSDWQFALFHPDDRHQLALGIRRNQRPDFRISVRETVPGSTPS